MRYSYTSGDDSKSDSEARESSVLESYKVGSFWQWRSERRRKTETEQSALL
jgi:hypothetical protein